eukprot:SAG22_NODE_578_length_8958_cov_5.402980_3_plen_79_part_00
MAPLSSACDAGVCVRECKQANCFQTILPKHNRNSNSGLLLQPTTPHTQRGAHATAVRFVSLLLCLNGTVSRLVNRWNM